MIDKDEKPHRLATIFMPFKAVEEFVAVSVKHVQFRFEEELNKQIEISYDNYRKLHIMHYFFLDLGDDVVSNVS